MRFALDMPNFAEFANPATIVALAEDAEAAGWDGFFIWDHINPFGEMPVPMADPWVLLAAVAQATERIKLGTAVTPVPRRRPWVLARQTATLDCLSGGRLMLGVGLGEPGETEFTAFGEEADIRVRAQKLDEGLATPIQRPRIPVWVAGKWPNDGPLRRAAAWDGYFPIKPGPDFGEEVPMTADEIREIRSRLEQLRDGRPADIVVAEEVMDPSPRDAGRLRAFAAAGVTWYMEGLGTRYLSFEAIIERVRQGPPRL
jgi:alkanesulfonate monooxygenase SsuD/methylene tetrahydromethanopterin reductase-like flavin-dependent oxidoreductase (luciferase family)